MDLDLAKEQYATKKVLATINNFEHNKNYIIKCLLDCFLDEVRFMSKTDFIEMLEEHQQKELDMLEARQ